MRSETIRTEVQKLLKQVPFRPFALVMENGDRVFVEHPENIAFQWSTESKSGSNDFYVFSGSLRMYSTFAAITGVAILDERKINQDSQAN
jgi:hypothetical protein